jgi:2-polyprenyl-3-methyl-5-hydroxy-6-metoxy-1,4-benzoquinol methylase
MRALSATTHKLQHELEWTVHPSPEWYDTYIGENYSWKAGSLSWVWDRGVFSSFAMPQGARVLDLCCGGGFFTRHFYAGRASEVLGVDFDRRAIAHAARYNSAPNVRYDVADIRVGIPRGPFDHVVWDAAIEHFTPAEIGSVLRRLRAEMAAGAMLTGYTIQERLDRARQHSEHEYEFSSMEDLARFLTPHFRNVLVFETIYPQRHNLHFIASDATLPFDADWPHAYRSSSIAPGVSAVSP